MREQERKKRKKLTVLAAAAGICILLAAGGVTAVLYQKRQASDAMIAQRQAEQAAPGVTEEEEATEELLPLEAEEVVVEDTEYVRMPYVKAILLMGVDRSGDLQEEQTSGSGGQADGVFLLAHNTSDSTVQILQIPRDTMTPITMTDLSGNVLGKGVQHLTLAYAYGDGREKSCENMVDAVSTLLGGLQIDGYMAVSTDVIAILNDMAGGVEVTIETEGLEAADPAFTMGSTVHLQGEQAERFVRYRDITEDNTALTRMDRQRQYIEAFQSTVAEASRQNANLVGEMFDRIQPYMVTNMDKGTYLRMAMDLMVSQQLEDKDFYLLPGEAVLTDLYDEYHPHQDEVYQLVLELFFRKKQS